MGWSTDIEKEDNAKIDKAEANNANDQLQKHKELLAERDLLKQFRVAKDEWVNEQMDAREEEYSEVSREREYRLQKKVAMLKIERAKDRMMKERKRLDDARAARKKKEDEERRRREEEERREQEEADRIEREEEEARRKEEEEERKREGKEQ